MRLTANDAHDDHEHGSVRTYVLRSQDSTTWQVTYDTAQSSLQPKNVPYN